MFIKIKYSNNLDEAYQTMLNQAEGLVDYNLPLVSNLANISALLYQFLNDINWVGFYLFDGTKLYLGPFQGLPACTFINLNRGVCGSAATKKQTIIVDDVDTFEDHIACDSASKSEIVIPIIKNNQLYGVLDIDSPIINRFNKTDQLYLEKLINNILLESFEEKK